MIKNFLVVIVFICSTGQVFSQKKANSIEIGFGLNPRSNNYSLISIPRGQGRLNFEFNHELQKERFHFIGNFRLDWLNYASIGKYEPRPLFMGTSSFNYSTYKANLISLGIGYGYRVISIKRFELDIECSLGYTRAINGQIFSFERFSYSQYEFDMNSFNYNLNLSPKVNLIKNFFLGIDFGMTDYFNRKLESKKKEFNYKTPIYIQLSIGRKLSTKKNN